MASSWGRVSWGALAVIFAVPARFSSDEARAGLAPSIAVAPADASAVCGTIEQAPMIHVFDTSDIPGGPHYVNDHTLIRGPDGAWHLFGIFHREPIGEDTEVDFIHAVAAERDPALWGEGAFVPAAEPYTIALHADRSVGETHVWAPHVVAADGRYWMMYQGGGPDDYRASIRLAESDDLYRWSRVGQVPLFEDFCAARDPMLVRREDVWHLYYTRCEALGRKVSGVAVRSSRDLVHWSEAHMALTTPSLPQTSNSAYTESPFVFERDGYHYLSVSAYPIGWDATLVYRSRAPFAFPDAPFTRLRAHAAEWIFGETRGAWITHAGPGQRGVWISAVAGI